MKLLQLSGGWRFFIFIAVVSAVKLLLMAVFSSEYDEKLFIPFINSFLAAPDDNTYAQFFMQNGFVAFPYPPVMLLLVSIGVMLANFSGGGYLLQVFLFKLPLLFFDLLGLYFFVQLYPHRRKYIGILYFASPIIMYATYMHGQLDIIPTTFLLGATAHVFYNGIRHRVLFSLFLLCAVFTKLHILAVIPLFVIYLLNRKDYQTLYICLLVLFVLGGIIVSPFAASAEFWQSVLFNNEQALITKVYLDFVSMRLYLPVLVLFFVYIQAYMLRNMNKDLFISFCGLLFGIFLALVPPMPGWYVWVVPFITAFFINVEDNRYKHLYLYGLLNVLYLLYFITAHQSSHIELYFLGNDMSWLIVENTTYRNIIFTLLTGVFIYLIYELYSYGIASNLFYRRRGKPFTIGIAGDSGTGKSTLLKILESCLGKKNMLFIEGDGDHKWERDAKMWKRYTHLNPKANYLYKQARDIAMLRRGAVIKRVEYDHNTGKFTEEHRIYPQRYILLSGLHAFYLPQMRQVLDLKIYMDTDETLRRYWKIQRDTSKRGYSVEKILSQIEARVPDTERYITPQREYADLIVSYFDADLHDCCIQNHDVVLSMRFVISSSINLEPVIENLHLYGIEMKYDFSENLDQQTVIFKGSTLNGARIDFSSVISRCIPHLEELTQEDLSCNNNHEGILHLMLLLVISHKMRM